MLKKGIWELIITYGLWEEVVATISNLLILNRDNKEANSGSYNKTECTYCIFSSALQPISSGELSTDFNQETFSYEIRGASIAY